MVKKNSKKSKDLQYDVICGVHSIIEMLKAKRRKLYSIYTTKPLPNAWDRIKSYLPKSIPNIQYVSKEKLDYMAGTQDHMGIVALVSQFQYQSKMFDPAKKPFVLLLDSIQDVRNLGAILRSAYCTGVTGVILCRKNAAPLNAAAILSSAGLSEHLDIIVMPTAQMAVSELKTAGYNLYMAALENGKDATKVTYNKPLCLVIGNEAVGISKNILKEGEIVTLPQRVPDISYNASVAAGILLFLISQKI
ncbi:MAG: RNA methyltransferase [Candidatus Babeliales bacterium]